MLEKDWMFVDRAGEVVKSVEEGYYPGLIEQVNQWVEEGLGVPLATRFDASEKPYNYHMLVGIALPLKYDNTQHVIILISGRKLLIQPRDEESIPRYKDLLSGERGIDIQLATDLTQIGDQAFNNKELGSTIVMTNQFVEGREFIEDSISHALQVAKYQAYRRMAVRK